jgi:hypothetical protein
MTEEMGCCWNNPGRDLAARVLRCLAAPKSPLHCSIRIGSNSLAARFLRCCAAAHSRHHWLIHTGSKWLSTAQLHKDLVVVVHVVAFPSWRGRAGQAVHIPFGVQVVHVRRPIAVLDCHHVPEVLNRHRHFAVFAAQALCLPGRPRDLNIHVVLQDFWLHLVHILVNHHAHFQSFMSKFLIRLLKFSFALST